MDLMPSSEGLPGRRRSPYDNFMFSLRDVSWETTEG